MPVKKTCTSTDSSKSAWTFCLKWYKIAFRWVCVNPYVFLWISLKHARWITYEHIVILHWITMNMPYAVPSPVWKCLRYGSTHLPYYQISLSHCRIIHFSSGNSLWCSICLPSIETLVEENVNITLYVWINLTLFKSGDWTSTTKWRLIDLIRAAYKFSTPRVASETISHCLLEVAILLFVLFL